MRRELTPRERVRLALDHREPDRVPIDIGGHAATSMAPKTYGNLCRYLGLPVPTQVRLMSKSLQIVYMEEPMLQALGSDCRPLIAPRLLTSGPVEWEGGEFTDEWGITWQRPESSLYYDVLRPPLAGMEPDDLAKYPWPDPYDPIRTAGLEEEAKRLAATDYAVVGIPSSLQILEQAMLMRGYEDLLLDLASNKPFVHALFQKLMEFNIVVYGEFLRLVGPYLDAIRTADDLGGTNAPLMSPQVYREMLQPYHKEWFAFIKKHTTVKIVFHSDGALYPLLPDLIDAGIDVLNPVQVFAKGMKIARLKHEFGDQLSFWGSVDTVNVLPRGSRAEVEAEVRQRVQDLAPGGGLILAGVHNIQPDVPPENIVAMSEAAREFGRYPVSAGVKQPQAMLA
jgi:uroporphyrinogen decarboxylase